MPFNQDNRINDNRGNIYNFNINLHDTAPERTPPYTSTVYNLDPTDISQTGQPINLERPRLVPTLDGDILELEDRGSLVSKIGAISTSGLRGLHVDVNGTPESLRLKTDDIQPGSSIRQRQAPAQDNNSSCLPQEINFLYGLLQSPDRVQSIIEKFLPPKDEAIALCGMVLEHLKWMFSIVSRKHLIGELILAIYDHDRRQYDSHDLALLFITLAIGVLVDPGRNPYDEMAHRYHQLAGAALSLQSIRRPIVTVKCLHLMSIYYGMSGKELNLENSYSFLNMALQFGRSIGLHMDPSLFGINGQEAYERCSYFWDLVRAILWQSLLTGHSPSHVLPEIGCHMLSEKDEETYEDGGKLGFGAWSCRFTTECLLPVTETILASNSPRYQTILELDRRIREFPIPLPSPDNCAGAADMQYFVRSHYKALTLMFLHRGHFMQALRDNPADPLNSAYRESFHTAYDCACAILNSTKEHYDKQPNFIPRVWRIWTNAFCAAVIIGTTAVNYIGVNLDPAPLQKLEDACALFERVDITSSSASGLLRPLLKMRTKALSHMSSPKNTKPGYPHVEPYDSELTTFGGGTVLVMPEPPVVTPAAPPPDSYGPGMMYSDLGVRPTNMQGEDVIMEDRWCHTLLMGQDVIMEDV